MRAKGGARLPSGSGSASERQSGANWHGGCLDDNAPDVFFAVVGCELRRVGTRPDLTILHRSFVDIQYLSETLRYNCPKHLQLSISFDSGLYLLSELFPPEVGDGLTHLAIFADINARSEWQVLRIHHISWKAFMVRTYRMTPHRYLLLLLAALDQLFPFPPL